MKYVWALLMSLATTCAQTEWSLGRATYYSPSDQFNSDWNTGTCRCWSSDSYRQEIPCFDNIADPSHIAAVDTSNMKFTGTCSTCVEVKCTDGPTRGLPSSTYFTPGCKDKDTSVIVQITDSCPCKQNESNKRWCCQDSGRGVRHLDLAGPAFTEIALEEAGVVDVLFRQVPCTKVQTGAEWDTWESEYDTTIEQFSKSKSDTLATVESSCGASLEGASISQELQNDIDIADLNRTVTDVNIALP